MSKTVFVGAVCRDNVQAAAPGRPKEYIRRIRWESFHQALHCFLGTYVMVT